MRITLFYLFLNQLCHHPPSSPFNQFGELLDYRLNLTKSELFPISQRAQALDISSLPFKIENNKFPYLGVSVTRKYKDLSKENFIRTLNQTKLILSGWSPMSMSLVARINSIQMYILPKFHQFRALPIFIPASFFRQLDSIISSSIWQDKKLRLNKTQP